MKKSRATYFRLFISYIFVLFMVALILIPLLFAVLAAFQNSTFNTLDNVSNFKFQIDFTAFQILFSSEYDYVKWLSYTIVVAVITTLISTSSVLTMSYVYSRQQFKGKEKSLFFFILIQMIPALAGLVAFIALREFAGQFFSAIGLTLPLEWLGYTKSQATATIILCMIYSAGGIPGNLFLLKGNLDIVSKEIDEAARIDGASHFRIFWQIILPLIRPMITVVSLFSFIGPFMDFILSPIILPSGMYTVAAYLYTVIFPRPEVLNTNFSVFAAGSLVVSIPIMIFFLIGQKNLVSGLTDGGAKG